MNIFNWSRKGCSSQLVCLRKKLSGSVAK